MLVLQRKAGQQVIVGGTVTVTVLEVRRGRVKLGFSAPEETPIHREELLQRVSKPLLRPRSAGVS